MMTEAIRVEYTMAMQNLRDAVDRMNRAASKYKPREYWNVTAFEYEVDDAPFMRVEPRPLDPDDFGWDDE